MVWNLVCFALSILVVLVQWYLDYGPHGKRSTEYGRARKTLLALLLLLLVAGVFAAIKEGRDRQEERTSLQRQLGALHKQEVANGRELRTRLRPFEKLAREWYPNASRDAAMSKLSTALVELGKRTDKVENRLQQRVISDREKHLMVDVLRGGQKCKVFILFPIGDREAWALAEQVNLCLRQAGWQTKLDSWGEPATGVVVGIPGKAQSAAFRAVMRAMTMAGLDPSARRNDRVLEGFGDMEKGSMTVLVGSKE